LVLGEKSEGSLSFRGRKTSGLSRNVLEFLATMIRNNGRATSADFNFSSSSIGRYKNKLNSVLQRPIVSYLANAHEYELLTTEKIFLLELA